MEKLELKHLAPYLPYGLKVQYLENEIVELVGFNRNTIFHTTGFFVELPCNLKPILRPLSDLTKEIEVDGKKFVPINLLELMYSLEYRGNKPLTMYIDGNWTDEIIELPYDLVSKLFSWNFDVFDLHSKGLCIYYNEL